LKNDDGGWLSMVDEKWRFIVIKMIGWKLSGGCLVVVKMVVKVVI
jgi:hypothetical protein